MKLAKQDQINQKHVDDTVMSAMDLSSHKIQSSLGNSMLSSTAIALPRLNVVLEGEKTSSDPTSSAKLVLSNLASGTLILSPVNVPGASRLSGNPVSPDHKLISCSSLQDMVAAMQKTTAGETAHAVANLFRTNDAIEEGTEGGGRSKSRSSSFDKVAELSASDARKLPCKLRFKNGQKDIAVD